MNSSDNEKETGTQRRINFWYSLNKKHQETVCASFAGIT